jgi:hypothetical protein
MSELGKLRAPYPVEHCANVACPHGGALDSGAYLYRDLESDKLCVFCSNCGAYVELNAEHRFKLVAL